MKNTSIFHALNFLIFALVECLASDFEVPPDISTRVVFKGEYRFKPTEPTPETTGNLEAVVLDGDSDLTPLLQSDLTLGRTAFVKFQLQVSNADFLPSSIQITDSHNQGIAAICIDPPFFGIAENLWLDFQAPLWSSAPTNCSFYRNPLKTQWDNLVQFQLAYTSLLGKSLVGTIVKIRLIQIDKVQSSPAICMMPRSLTYKVDCVSCHCEKCHSCGCHAVYTRKSCNNDVCNSCWCSGYCGCCYDEICDFECNCQQCCNTNQFNYCLTSSTIHLDSLHPSYGTSLGGNKVTLFGGPFLLSVPVFCNFSNSTVQAVFVSVNQVKCTVPRPTASFLKQLQVPVSLSIDHVHWTTEDIQYSYVHCQNGCNGHGECTSSFFCSCEEGWVGANCELECPGSNIYSNTSGTVCSGQGECYEDDENSLAFCACHHGYAGPSCNITCPKNWNNETCSGISNGVCNSKTGVCSCLPGWSGIDCSLNTCSNTSTQTQCVSHCPGFHQDIVNSENKTACSGNGICLGIDVCYCNAGYWGTACEDRCANCQGDCVSFPGTCVCSEDKYGMDCSQLCPRNNETELQCSGHGRCDHIKGCVCEYGWQGNDCSSECAGGDITPCSGHGTCLSQPPGMCSCFDGWFGSSCNSSCPGTEALPCSGHGQCAHPSGECQCKAGWFGFNCSFECPGGLNNSCNGHGTCNYLDGSCACNEGFWGNSCEKQCPGMLSDGSTCNRHGDCGEDGNCTCYEGFSGTDCSQLTCDSDCNNHGSCFQGTCHCSYGYMGIACDIITSQSEQNTTELSFVQFDQQNYFTSEQIGTVWINASRYGSTEGKISIHFSTKDVSALSGEDYELRTGVLVWESGEWGEQSIQLTILPNDRPESEEVFEVVLFLPWPAQKCYIGDQSKTMISIQAKPDDTVISLVRVIFKSLRQKEEIREGTESGEIFKETLLDTVIKGIRVPRDHLLISSLNWCAEGGTLITMDILPHIPDSYDINAPASALSFRSLVANPFSVLYSSDVDHELAIDITFEPLMSTLNAPNEDANKTETKSDQRAAKKLHALTMTLIVLMAVMVVAAAIVFWKRKAVSEYFLWKLAAFRFRSLHEDRQFDEFDESHFGNFEIPQIPNRGDDHPSSIGSEVIPSSQTRNYPNSLTTGLQSLLGRGSTVPSLSPESNM